LVQSAYQLTMKSAVKNSTKVLAITEFTKKDVIKYLGATEDKVTVIYEASDEKIQLVDDQDFIKKVKEKYGLKKPFYFFLSNLRIHKNVERMVKAFEILRDQGLDVQLLVVGKPDPRYLEALESIENSKYRSDIVRPGFVPDDEVAVFYTEAVAFVYPTLYEGFGLPGLEAMSCGLPVIASEASCLPEVLGEGVLYFDPYDPNEIAGAMRQILEDKKLRHKLINAGYRQCQKYSWAKMGQEIVELYRKILA